ncbi:uncharacterized protein [Onthophagus taurus]|uniref:uncharacterized protein isoform X2 n=1 Tax=Onthophagus taurus TaxID=166361 RepID=UPI0039BDA81A
MEAKVVGSGFYRDENVFFVLDILAHSALSFFAVCFLLTCFIWTLLLSSFKFTSFFGSLIRILDDFFPMSQDGFSQIDLTAPGFVSNQESFLLNSFDINLLNISTVEKALDPNVQPNEQPMDPNVESNTQQDPSLLNIIGSANIDDKNVKRLAIRRNSGNREHWKNTAA